MITMTTLSLSDKIHTKSAAVGIIGLGYVGLPTALHKAAEGYPVTGFDVSSDKVDSLNAGSSYIEDIESSFLASLVQSGKLKATTNFRSLSEMDVVVICVPTPINQYKEPDLSFVRSASASIAQHISENTLILLESTTYPGTTEEILVPELLAAGFRPGEDVFVSYSPERVDPGNQHYGVENTPKVVGGYSNKCLQLATQFIGPIAYPVSSLKVAEMAKVFENSFRYINLGFVNEMTTLAHRMKIDIWEVIEASSTKPYGFMKFTPGIGVGGHCIPVDPYYLTYKAREYGERTKMIELAGELNDGMTDYTYYRMMELLNDCGKVLSASAVVVLGVSYKEDIGDVRESPVLPLIEKIALKTPSLTVVDPWVDEFRVHGFSYEPSALTEELLKEADIVVLGTAHSDFPYDLIATNSSLILDTKNAFAKRDIYSPAIKKL